MSVSRRGPTRSPSTTQAISAAKTTEVSLASLASEGTDRICMSSQLGVASGQPTKMIELPSGVQLGSLETPRP